MAGSGHLQTFRLLRFLRNRSSVDGHANYGIQMAVMVLNILNSINFSLCTFFLQI